ncbi:hypothetical protein GCM10023085_45680 [Actinomadura viridis]|uniref:Uncharacterized protein n=1 Tax=Actinomadura viridis TaxID=58110 RepID=A0A931GRP0_9ACTN|nr:hypothetical protein [Actinomadura viridis]MBG6089929.1 hypothetical protein [Actinomadura viridis]
MASTIHSIPADRDDGGQRPCARGDRCINATVTFTGGQRIIEPALGYRALCDADREFTLRCLEQLPAYHRELGERIGDKSSTGHGPKVSGSKNAPIPINLTFDTLRVELVNVISSWAGRIYRVAGLAGRETDRSLEDRARYGAPFAAYPDQPFEEMCETLAARLDALLALPAEPMTRTMTTVDADDLPEGTPVRRNHWTGTAEAILELDGGDAALEMFRLNARCRWTLGHTGKDEKIAGRCFSCDQLDVLVRPDLSAGLEDYAECSACGTRYFGAEYTNLLRAVYEAELDKLRHSA